MQTTNSYTIELQDGKTLLEVVVEAETQAEAKKIAYKNYLMGKYNTKEK